MKIECKTPEGTKNELIIPKKILEIIDHSIHILITENSISGCDDVEELTDKLAKTHGKNWQEILPETIPLKNIIEATIYNLLYQRKYYPYTEYTTENGYEYILINT